jgi:predicted O-methyltransferase YrrM
MKIPVRHLAGMVANLPALFSPRHKASDQGQQQTIETNPFLSAWPAGHFYSPLPSMEHIKRREAKIFETPRAIPGIDLNESGQLNLLDQLSRYYCDQPFSDEKAGGLRYFFDNPNFRHDDAIILYCMMRHARPKRIIEIGSGYSSCAMLDTSELFFNGSIACTFVDPYPELLFSLIRSKDKDNVEIVDKNIQDVGTDIFAALSAGDILFVDSSHVCKIDSDVNDILFRVLPMLQPGVLVHFHDIYYPFEYPREWIYQGRGWNEAYLLRAFLQYNSLFEIQLFNSYIDRFHEDRLAAQMPLCSKSAGSSLWITSGSI